MPTSLIFGIVTALAAILAWRLALVWLRYRGKHLVTCPENQNPAGVSLSVGHAVLTGIGHVPHLRLNECSRWPEKAGCGQECLNQIRESGPDCLIRNIVAKWYRGKSCAACGQSMDTVDWTGNHPALLMDGGSSMEWNEVPADTLHETLAGAQPLCFACHTVKRMVREHPELVIDRHRTRISN